MALSQGTKAIISGKSFEEAITALLDELGFVVIKWSQYHKQGSLEPKKKYVQLPRVVVKNYPYTTIYGSKGRSEFVLIDRTVTPERRVRIEAKWQSKPGSVDEKLPYVWLSAVFAYEEDEVVLVIDGEGYKHGAKEWITSKSDEMWLVDKDGDKKIEVKTFASMRDWLMEEFG